jgi:hypothetical protein
MFNNEATVAAPIAFFFDFTSKFFYIVVQKIDNLVALWVLRRLDRVILGPPVSGGRRYAADDDPSEIRLPQNRFREQLGFCLTSP